MMNTRRFHTRKTLLAKALAIAGFSVSAGFGTTALAEPPFVIKPVVGKGFVVHNSVTGNFAALWEESDNTTQAMPNYAQIFSASGVAKSDVFPVIAPHKTDGATYLTNAALDNNDQLRVLTTNNTVCSISYPCDYSLQQYATDGSAVGAPIALASVKANSSVHNRTAMNDAGDVVIGWNVVRDIVGQINNCNPCIVGEGNRMYVSAYKFDGKPLIQAQLIDVVPLQFTAVFGLYGGYIYYPGNVNNLSSISLNDADEFVIAFDQLRSDRAVFADSDPTNGTGGTEEITAQVFSATSQLPLTPRVKVTARQDHYLLYKPQNISTGIDVGGNFAVAAIWASASAGQAENVHTLNDLQLHGARFSASGKPLSTIGPIITATNRDFVALPNAPTLTMAGNGAFALSWPSILYNAPQSATLQFYGNDGIATSQPLMFYSYPTALYFPYSFSLAADANGNLAATWTDGANFYGDLIPAP